MLCGCSCVSLMSVYKALVVAWLASAAAVFVRVSAVSYGNVPLTDEIINQLHWLDSWDFSV